MRLTQRSRVDHDDLAGLHIEINTVEDRDVGIEFRQAADGEKRRCRCGSGVVHDSLRSTYSESRDSGEMMIR